MIKPPQFDSKKSAKRAILEGIAQATPLTAIISRIYQATYPSHDDKEMKEFVMRAAEAISHLEQAAPEFAAGGYSASDRINVLSIIELGCNVQRVNFSVWFENSDYAVHTNSEEGFNFKIENKTPSGFDVKKTGEELEEAFKFSFLAYGDLA